MYKLDPMEPERYFLATSFTWKLSESSDCIFPFPCQETDDIIILPEVDRIQKKL